MELELQPFPGATFGVAKFGKVTIMNFASPSVNDECFLVNIVYKELDTGDLCAVPVDKMPDAKSVLLLLTSKRLQWPNVIAYIVSKESVIPVLSQAEGLLGIRKVAKERHKKPIKSGRSIDEMVSGIPHMHSRLVQHSTTESGFFITGTYHLRPMPGIPMTSARMLFAKDDFDHTIECGKDIVREWKIGAETEKSFIQYIEEALRPSLDEDLTTKDIVDILDRIYSNPMALLSIYYAKEPLPSLDFIQANKAKLVASANEYAKQLQDLITNCYCQVSIPPMPSEEAFRVLSKVEIAIAPKILDQEFLFERSGKTGDVLYEKMYQHISAASQKKADRLTFTYGDLIDAGQIFTYGECAELLRRSKKLA